LKIAYNQSYDAYLVEWLLTFEILILNIAKISMMRFGFYNIIDTQGFTLAKGVVTWEMIFIFLSMATRLILSLL
jgi:hypothetical protein